MNKKIAYTLSSAILFCLAFPVLAQSIPNFLPGVSTFGDLLGKIATGVGQIVGALGGLMLIIAGIFYLTSAGSPERINTAKKALFYAIVGMAIGLAATAIKNWVLSTIGAS